MSDALVSNNLSRHRYELRMGEKIIGFSEYNLVGHDAVLFSHTEIEEGHEGKGYGSQLARSALDDVRAQGKQVIPMCPFIAAFIRRHHEYLEIVRPDMRAALGI